MSVLAGLQVNMPLGQAVKLLARTFQQSGIDSADTDARLLMGHVLGLNRAQLVSHADRVLEPNEIETLSAIAMRRLRREPVSRIFGRREFWTLSLEVTPDVLDPRPETETLIEAALDFVTVSGLRAERMRILDIGTGTGALLLALLHELPEAIGIGTDISEAAIAVARRNAARNGLTGRAQFVACDMASGVRGPFTLVVSNPPYIPDADIDALDPEVREYDPRLALSGGHDGLDIYRRLAQDAERLLATEGRMIVELGIHQEAPVAALFRGAGLTVNDAKPDLAGISRALSAGMPS